MAAQYAFYFQAILLLYCVFAFFLIRKPLAAFASFLFFRSNLTIAAYLQVTSIGSLQYFVLPTLILFAPTFRNIFSKHASFKPYGPMIFYYTLLTWVFVHAIIFSLIEGSFASAIEVFLKCAFPLMAYFLVHCGIHDKTDLQKICKYVVWVSALPVITGLLQYVFNIEYDYVHDIFAPISIAPAGTLIGRNMYGIFLSLTLFHAIPYVFEKRTKAGYLYLILLLSAIVVSQNRGTWIALATSFILSMHFFKHKINLAKGWAIVTLCVLLASPILIARFDQLSERDQWGQNQNTAEGRLELVASLWQKIKEKPLIGWGANAYGNITEIEASSQKSFMPHNDYIRLATEFGVIAPLLFFFFLYKQFVFSYRRRKDSLWTYQFAACMSQIYLIIIACVQNLITDMTTFLLIFSMMAISHRAAALSRGEPIKKRISLVSNI